MRETRVTANPELSSLRCSVNSFPVSVSGEAAFQNISKNLKNSHLGMTLTPDPADGFLVRRTSLFHVVVVKGCGESLRESGPFGVFGFNL